MKLANHVDDHPVQHYWHSYTGGLSYHSICHNSFEDRCHLLVTDLQVKINGLVQERRNSSALAMELRLSCTDPSKWVAMIWTDDELPVLKFTKWPPGWHALFMIAPCHFRSSSWCVLYDNIKPTTSIDTACCLQREGSSNDLPIDIQTFVLLHLL